MTVPKKKTTKKKAAPAAKKKIKKAALVCANGSECFWTTDGRVLSNLVELRDSLSAMGDEAFKHHVTKDKNDFADWIEYILGDKALAKALRKAKKATSARTIVVRRLKTYDI